VITDEDGTRSAAYGGDDAMHGDLTLEGFDPQDAIDVLSLMDDVLARAYQVRARTSDVVARRKARKASPPAAPRRDRCS
jgi:hypothetical protein